MGHYYESHVTLEPVEGDRLELLTKFAGVYGFRVAELLMRREGGREDSFCTARHADWDTIVQRTMAFVRALQGNDYAVRRYKIEDTLVDSKIEDEWKLL